MLSKAFSFAVSMKIFFGLEKISNKKEFQEVFQKKTNSF